MTRPDGISVRPITKPGLNAFNLAQMVATDLCRCFGLPYDRAIIRKEVDGGVHLILEEGEFEWPFAVCEVVDQEDIAPFWFDVVNHYTLGVYSR